MIIGVKVIFCPSLALKSSLTEFLQFTIFVISASTNDVICAEVDLDIVIWAEISFLILSISIISTSPVFAIGVGEGLGASVFGASLLISLVGSTFSAGAVTFACEVAVVPAVLLLKYLIISALDTLPSLPVPGIEFNSSIPIFSLLAILLTRGE